MQRVHDDTVITLILDDLPDSASRTYVKDHKTTVVPKEQQKGKSFGSTQTLGGDFPKVSGKRRLSCGDLALLVSTRLVVLGMFVLSVACLSFITGVTRPSFVSVVPPTVYCM